MLEIFQREVLQLALELVETELVGKRGIEVGSFLSHITPCLVVRVVLYLTHEVDAVRNHDEYDPHVLGKREEEVTEVLAFHNGVFLVKLTDALKPVKDACHGLPKLYLHLVDGQETVLYARMQQDGEYGVTP